MAPAQSPRSEGTAHTAAGKPSSAPSARAPHGALPGLHLKIRSTQGPLGRQNLTQAVAAVRTKIKEGSVIPGEELKEGVLERLKGSPWRNLGV